MKKTSPFKTSIIVVIILAVLASGGLLINHLFLNSGDLPVEEEQLAQTETEPPEEEEEEIKEEDDVLDWLPEDPGTHANILLLGLDSNGISDAIMVASYNMETYESALIGLKRDTFVADQDWAEDKPEYSHLGYAHYIGMGPENDYHHGGIHTLLWVQHLLDIPIHGYASINFEGFVELVDTMGGVVIDVDPGFAERTNNPLPTGKQTLDGNQALIYARHRQNPRIPEPGSNSHDGDRVRRNQYLLKALLKQAKGLAEEEMLDIFQKLQDNLHTSLDDWDLLTLANLYYHNDLKEIEMIVLPGQAETIYDDDDEFISHLYHLDKAATKTILQDLGLKQ